MKILGLVLVQCTVLDLVLFSSVFLKWYDWLAVIASGFTSQMLTAQKVEARQKNALTSKDF